MEGRICLILMNGIVAEHQSVNRFGIKDRSIEGFKLIILDHNTTVEILFLMLQIWYVRGNGVAPD